MRFRPALPDDLDDMLALLARCDEEVTEWTVSAAQIGEDRELLRPRIGDPSAWIEVALDGDPIVGFANFWPRVPGIARLSYVFVDPGRQGSGIGGELLARATAEMRSRGFERADLLTQEPNAPARRFYERAGWRGNGVRKRLAGFDCDMVGYELVLHP